MSAEIGAAESTDQSRTVLIVDDSELTRAMICDVLHGHGHRTIEAGNGREALERLVHDSVDLILLDLDMPTMSGFEFLQTRQGDPELGEVPVVVFSSRGASEDLRRCLELEADAFLVKSDYSEKTFLATIERYLA